MSAELSRVSAWRTHLKAERTRLIDAYLAKPHATRLLSGLAKLVDAVLADIWAAHDLPAQAALIAVGGYGRGELYPQSDVDLLLLLDDRLPETEHARFEPLIALFWDVGLPIGHSVRTLNECADEAAKDITVQTNLLEARLLAGNVDLFQRMLEKQDELLNPVAFFQAKLMEQKARHGRQADVAMVLEPNLKESPGGLRDLHTLLWTSQAAGLASAPGSQNPSSPPRGPSHRLADLSGTGLLRKEEYTTLRADIGYIEHLRIRLHLLANRREDRLLFEFQESIAAGMGVKPNASRRASERMMQRYYRVARHIRLINELGLCELRRRLLPQDPIRSLPGQEDFRAVGHLLDADEAVFERHPEHVFLPFLLLTQHRELQGCTPQLLRALWRAGRLIDADFRNHQDNKKRFIEILAAPRGVTHALRLMHRLGLLGKYIPMFGRITGQMQHDHFHIYPVDEHILMVLRNLRRLALSEYAHEFPLAHRVMVDFQRQELLMLAALFHDIAKGRGGDHSSLGAVDAQRFCLSQGLSTEDADLVRWLVAEHLMLSQTAQKQDLSDPDVVSAFAKRCGTVQRLTALYLLTVADIRGTSPKVWNAWKDKLTQELYLATRQVLEGGQRQIDSVETRKEQAREQLRLYGFTPGSEETLWKRLDDVYFLRQESRDIAWQTRRLLPMIVRRSHIVCTRLAPVGEGIEVLVYAPDDEALFARVCTFFAHLGYSILSARIHTTRDGHVLDTFYAVDPQQRQVAYRDILNYIEHELQLNLTQKPAQPTAAHPIPTGRLPRQLKAFPLSPSLSLVPSEHGRSHLLSFTAGDRPGLLANVAHVLSLHGINVISARINTLGNRAEDIFVIHGEALEQHARKLALEQDLLQTLRL